MVSQEALRDLWKGGQQDRLSPWMSCLALAYRDASREMSKTGRPNIAWVATKVTRVDGTHPGTSALHEFFAKVDADPDWFPGKHNGRKRGRKAAFTAGKRRVVADCAMRIKTRGDEPTAEEVLQRCPVSTLNPATGKPFSLKLIRQVFSTDCYDLDPDHPWRFQVKNKKVFLTEEVMRHRVDMCRWFVNEEQFTAKWFYDNVVWTDPCSSIIPGSHKQYIKMRQALKGDKGWQSDNAKREAVNARGPSTALKQTIWEGTKANWVIIFAKGVVGVDILPVAWTLDSVGMAVVVRRLKERLRDMLGAKAS